MVVETTDFGKFVALSAPPFSLFPGPSFFKCSFFNPLYSTRFCLNMHDVKPHHGLFIFWSSLYMENRPRIFFRSQSFTGMLWARSFPFCQQQLSFFSNGPLCGPAPDEPLYMTYPYRSAPKLNITDMSMNL